MAQMLVAKGALPNLPDAEGCTAAHVAASAGHSPMLRWLLVEGGCRSEVKDSNDWSMLHFAAWHGHTATIELLLHMKASQSLILALERTLREQVPPSSAHRRTYIAVTVTTLFLVLDAHVHVRVCAPAFVSCD
jgi:ankyrin repeat protein